MSKLKIFSLSLLAGIALTLGWFAATAAPEAAAPPPLARLTEDIQVSEQIRPEHLAALKNQGIRTVIDLRPDGEAPGQPSANAMAQAAQQADLQFSYVPVPHGDVPAAAVDALAQLLAQSPRPVLLYCRSGARAVRTWALAEASRPGGLDADSIKQHARSVGRPIDELQHQLAQRIAARSSKP
ncbi:MAG: TIGR01244 family phosphatase [Burkholderiaceae bacterium]|jgi:uncharacterized protein (TIGR01244 family)|nr:TIGR01244 family phosphatase [Burkholderiaceae bacterium]